MITSNKWRVQTISGYAGGGSREAGATFMINTEADTVQEMWLLVQAAPELLEVLKRTLEIAIRHACEARGINESEAELWGWVINAREMVAKASNTVQ